MKNLPIGIHTFSDLITQNYLYVDKTKDIFNLFARGGKYYFLSRPRRFGKSLLIFTLKEIFSGNKELFKGLWIYDKIDWEKYPVIHVDFLGLKYGNKEELIETIEYLIAQNAALYEIKLKENGYDKRFRELIAELSKKNKVVILVDEYDKPIIDFVEKNKKDIATENRDILRNFYSVIKGADEYLKFAFITGVSKFSKVSVFSVLNNLNDITLDEKYATMLGYTEEELLHYFPVPGADSETLDQIRTWYNGYSWDGKRFVYNPFSILLYFEKKAFADYWFATGTPTFLIKAIKEKDIPVMEFEKVEADTTTFESFEIENMEITPLLFQTGYLTIKGKEVTDDGTIYQLSYPNKEVRESFLKHLLKDFTEKRSIESLKILRALKSSLDENHLDSFFSTIKSLFASIPYDIFIQHREGYYHTIIYLLLRLAGITIQPESESNIGRVDAVAETETHIYIIEFKIGTSEEALKQIKEKKYYEPYLASGKVITLLGIGIDPEQRNIGTYISEQLTR
jgi:hypothetical protein